MCLYFRDLTHLNEVFGKTLIKSLMSDVEDCLMFSNDKTSIVTQSDGKDHVVRSVSKGFTCDCQTSKKIKICGHIIAVAVKFKRIEEIAQYARAPTLSGLILDKKAGSKPGAGRKGSRTPKARPYKTLYNLENEYVVCKMTNSISICQGCRQSLVGESHVIRHSCRAAYHKKLPNGNVVLQTPPKPWAHHFHIDKSCVVNYHKTFNGNVKTGQNVSISAVHGICMTGNINII